MPNGSELNTVLDIEGEGERLFKRYEFNDDKNLPLPVLSHIIETSSGIFSDFFKGDGRINFANSIKNVEKVYRGRLMPIARAGEKELEPIRLKINEKQVKNETDGLDELIALGSEKTEAFRNKYLTKFKGFRISFIKGLMNVFHNYLQNSLFVGNLNMDDEAMAKKIKKEFNLCHSELTKLMTCVDKNQFIVSEIRPRFITKINQPKTYHSFKGMVFLLFSSHMRLDLNLQDYLVHIHNMLAPLP